MDRPETAEVTGPSGGRYRVELGAEIEGPGENLRVMVWVEATGPTNSAPVTDDFTVSPQGTFIRE